MQKDIKADKINIKDKAEKHLEGFKGNLKVPEITGAVQGILHCSLKVV